jgi:deazaflavin-dependent oxidoreductase (nitroreductase family)
MTTVTREENPMHTATIDPHASVTGPPAHYLEPDWFTRHVFNSVVKGLTRLGVSVWGSRILEHRGRASGKLHHTPVNVLTVGGTQYLVSPRGQTQWVRNVRHAGGHMVLILGRRRRLCTATEVPVADSVPILRAYLRRWKFEVGTFFDGINPDSSDAEWDAVAADHPVFELR